MRYFDGDNVCIKCWCNDPEETAIEQAKNLANLPFIYRHVALMPDTHMGYGMPIGGVIACKNVVIPNAVGVDIGCGMLAVQTTLTEISTEDLKKIMGSIRTKIPVGFNHHKEEQDENLMPQVKYNLVDNGGFIFCDYPVCWKQYESALKQLGTLGGGNHFIEIQKGSDGYIWFMIHSGSRNLGKQVADHYNKVAVELNERWCTQVPPGHQLAFLPTDTKEAETYIKEMNYCLRFASASRRLMAERIRESFQEHVTCKFDNLIDIHHNYAAIEHHFGKNVWVHRKGATSAKEGQVGIIPGSQGTRSYIVCGKGNRESFMSCSHGAGRCMSRTKARKELSLEDEKQKMCEVLHSVRNKNDLDEAPGAYKDIDVVMHEQEDLVTVLVELTPLAVIKG